MGTSLAPFIVPGGSHLPDNDQWTNRFEIRSASSSRLYVVAQNKLGGHWACSCPGWKIHRTCKHIKTIKVPTLPALQNRLGGGTISYKPASGKNPLDGYKTYQGQRGSATDWEKAFAYRMGIDAARKVVGDKSPRGILGVSAFASFKLIKAAYRALAMKHHPDQGGDSAYFQLVQGAYEVLEHEWIRRGRPV